MRATPPHEGVSLQCQGSYGTYRLTIGPEYPPKECRRRGVPLHSRSVAVDAAIDHLFIRGGDVTAWPDKETIERHLQGTVIIHGVAIHIYDGNGSGDQPEMGSAPAHDIKIDEIIAFTHPEARETIDRLRSSGRLTVAAYHVIQHDILKALQRHEVALTTTSLA